MSTTIEDRMILTLTALKAVAGYGFWQEWGSATGITVTRWKSLFARKQRATADMVAAVARAHPQFAFWLATGITDAAHGHVAPPNVQTFPERQSEVQALSQRYFHQAMQLSDAMFERSIALGTYDPRDDDDRLRVVSRGPWIRNPESVFTPLGPACVEVCSIDEYAAMLRTWRRREAGLNWAASDDLRAEKMGEVFFPRCGADLERLKGLINLSGKTDDDDGQES